MESRIHGDMYVRFGGRLVETYHRKVEKRCWPSLLIYRTMYLECTCSQISIEKWKQKMKNSRPLNYGWLVRRIKKQLPLLYKELCLEFYNPWENQCRVNREYYILVHSAIEYFIRKE